MKITKNAQKQINKIGQQYHLKLALIYGSFAKGKNHRDSDLDIAVFFAKIVLVEKRKELTAEIEDELARAVKMPEKVDVVCLNDAPPLMEREVVYNGRLIFCQDESAKAHYEAGAMGRWLDWKWHEDKLTQAIKGQFLKPVKSYG